ncbi:MAG: hypothetical protein AAF646_08900 [Pseudomonadota bacterium]
MAAITDKAAKPGASGMLAAGLAAFAAALAVRLVGIDSRDLWLDEIYTQFAASRDWLGLIDDRVSRGHSPFYFALLKLSGIDPADIAALRALSAVFDAGAAGILAAGVLRYFGARAALMVAVLYVLAPLQIHWAQNARPYGLLMFFTALGLTGAIGLVAAIGQDDAARGRGPDMLFAVGWSGACFTLTGGILAYLVVLSVPWWPGLRNGALADPGFRRRWVRAQRLPSVVAFLTYMLVSRIHVFDRIGDYWLEDRRPFGLESLTLLGEEIAAGAVGQSRLTLMESAGLPLAMLTLVAVLCAATFSVTRPALWPKSLPLAALGLGLLCLMLAMSLNTSLLTGRYFTPAWLGLLTAAGIGIATLRPALQVAVAAPLVALMLPLALTAATAPSDLRAEAPKSIAALIDTVSERHAPMVIDRAIFREVRMELMLLRLDEPALPRPAMNGAEDGEAARERAADGAPFFIVARPGDWHENYHAEHASSACLAERDGWSIALVRPGTAAACAPPFPNAP